MFLPHSMQATCMYTSIVLKYRFFGFFFSIKKFEEKNRNCYRTYELLQHFWKFINVYLSWNIVFMSIFVIQFGICTSRIYIIQNLTQNLGYIIFFLSYTNIQNWIMAWQIIIWIELDLMAIQQRKKKQKTIWFEI